MKAPGRLFLSRATRVLAALVSLAMALPALRGQQTPVGGIARNFTLTNRANGLPLRLHDYAGHIVVLDFFAYWCGPCQTSSPDIEQNIQQFYEARGGNPAGIPVTVIAVNIEAASPALTDTFVRNAGMGLVGDDTTLFQAWSQFGQGYIPHFVVINGEPGSPSHAQWQVLYSTYGYYGAPTLRALIDAVQAAPAPPPPTITSHPSPASVVAFEPATFTVAATSTGAMTYRWQHRAGGSGTWVDLVADVTYSGCTTATLTIAAPIVAMSGDQYRCVVANPDGSVESTTATLVVAKASQTITFPAIAATTYGVAPFAAAATASSGLEVSCAVVAGPASVTEHDMIAVTGAGSVTILASQAGDANFHGAAPVENSFTVAKAAALVSLGGLVSLFDGTAKPVNVATEPTGLAVTLTYNGTAEVPFAIGTYDVLATVADPNYQASATGHLVISQIDLTTGPTRITAGQPVELTSSVQGTASATYQWQIRRGGEATPSAHARAIAAAEPDWVDLPGATAATLVLASAQRFDVGTYRVVVTIDGVALTSAPVVVNVDAPAPSNARLLNLSTRGLAEAGANQLFPGFVVSGAGTKKLLIRAIGPTLDAPPINFGGGTIPDPAMQLKQYNFTTQAYEDVIANDDWQSNPNAAAIITTSASLGAFELKDTRDAVLLVDLAAGQSAVVAGDKNGASGIGIVELYDADAGNPAATLINISNRGFCGVGAQVMIPGFVVSSGGPKTLLVRVVGPKLAFYNVPGTMADPKLTFYRTNPATGVNTELFTQDNWSDIPDAAYTTTIATQVSAFPLDAGSADAAFVVTLEPGVYTVIGSSADGTSTGVVLVEVYVVP